ncbi:30S ribosomal protein S9 [Candidatus Nanohalobium constans]|uniref:30S ribosomal protein S9 n=1 Tax=Candidatus Nanohalobium constans TaxID=2565781 RepID=A0A5Q0UIG1_9ARCH|nr:30S ribosomal protein S9 [Candidatus Nanohalobium constans]QGA80920.1 30S Ribosomal protein S9 [Candidatus Nanohalobium constans]
MATHTSGRRKTAKARATVKEDGEGTLRVNSRPLHTYRDMFESRVEEPLTIAGEEVFGDLEITVDTEGGGIQAQAEAARMAVARALVDHTGSDDLERDFREYDRNMMVEDPRRTETHKPSQSSKGARHKQQKSYR